jgi:hypothetical protein
MRKNIHLVGYCHVCVSLYHDARFKDCEVNADVAFT